MKKVTYNFTRQELNFPFEASEYSRTAMEFLPQVPKGEYPYFINLAQKIVEESYSGIRPFEFGLKPIWEGLDKSLGDWSHICYLFLSPEIKFDNLGPWGYA